LNDIIILSVRHKRFNKIAPFHTHTVPRKGHFQSCNASNNTQLYC
jgi:hypothetical protein